MKARVGHSTRAKTRPNHTTHIIGAHPHSRTQNTQPTAQVQVPRYASPPCGAAADNVMLVAMSTTGAKLVFAWLPDPCSRSLDVWGAVKTTPPAAPSAVTPTMNWTERQTLLLGSCWPPGSPESVDRVPVPQVRARLHVSTVPVATHATTPQSCAKSARAPAREHCSSGHTRHHTAMYNSRSSGSICGARDPLSNCYLTPQGYDVPSITLQGSSAPVWEPSHSAGTESCAAVPVHAKPTAAAPNSQRLISDLAIPGASRACAVHVFRHRVHTHPLPKSVKCLCTTRSPTENQRVCGCCVQVVPSSRLHALYRQKAKASVRCEFRAVVSAVVIF